MRTPGQIEPVIGLIAADMMRDSFTRDGLRVGVAPQGCFTPGVVEPFDTGDVVERGSSG
jgi:hypothetical protein